MPDYKKKKHIKKIFNSKKEYNDDSFEIKVSSKNEAYKKKPRVIRGNKNKKAYRLKAFLCVVLIFSVVLLLSYVLFPVGIGETLSNFTLAVGNGEYPITLSGSTVRNVCPNDNYYFVLTDTYLYSFSNSGKEIMSENHGFSSPVVKTSETRALVYDQGQKVYGIYTVGKKIMSGTSDREIICSDICDSGSFAIASFSDSYASTFSVYDKSGKVEFTWNCAKETINSLSLSPNGKKVAVSTVAAVNGDLSSKVYIFSIDNTNPIKSFDYGGTVFSLCSNRNGVFVISDDKYDFINWKADARKENQTDFSVDFFRNSSSGPILVINRKNDRTDNTVIVLSGKADKQTEFSYNGNISDIRKKGSHIYLIGDAYLYIFDLKGNLISKTKCGHDFRFLIPTGSRNANLVSDNEINQIYVK